VDSGALSIYAEAIGGRATVSSVGRRCRFCTVGVVARKLLNVELQIDLTDIDI